MSSVIFYVSLILLIVTFPLSLYLSNRQLEYMARKYSTVTNEKFENNIVEDILILTTSLLVIIILISGYFKYFVM